MPSPAVAALKVRNYRLFAAGQVVSNTGTWAQRIAQDWLVLTLTHDSGLALGLTGMLQSLPMLFLGLWGGVVADRRAKRTVLVLTQASMGALAAGLGVLTVTGAVRPWHVYLCALGLGLATVFDQPARQSFTIEMVGPERLPAAVAVNSITFNGARVVGPAVAAAAIGWAGTGPMFLLNAASYAAVLAGLAAMRPGELYTAEPAAHGPRPLREGLRYVRARPALLLPIVVIGVVSGFGQSLQVILPLLAKQDLHQAASGYGLLTVGLAAGSVGGAVLATRRRRPRAAPLVAAAAAFGVFETAVAVMPTAWACFLVLVPAGVAGLTVNTTANAGVQLGARAGMRGRAMALYMVVLLSANSLGSMVLGAVAQAAGARTAIAAGGVTVTAGISLAVWLLARLYRTPVRRLLRAGAAPAPSTMPAGPAPASPPARPAGAAGEGAARTR